MALAKEMMLETSELPHFWYFGGEVGSEILIERR